jgi:hypothetical protein
MEKELTKDEEIKLGNFGEQFASIRKNVEVANSELGGILKAKDEESVAFESRLKEHSEMMAKLRAEKEEMLDFIVMERASLAGDIRKLEADRKEFDAYQFRTRIEIASEKLFAEAITTQAQTVVLSLSQQEKNLTSEVEVLGAQVMKLSEEEKKLDRSVKYLDLSISELGDEFIATKRNRDDMIVLANKEIKAKQIELMDIEARIQEEIKKIEIPYTTLMLERQNFEKFRMDVRVMYDRANRLWCAMYPGQSLEDILIKQ